MLQKRKPHLLGMRRLDKAWSVKRRSWRHMLLHTSRASIPYKWLLDSRRLINETSVIHWLTCESETRSRRPNSVDCTPPVRLSRTWIISEKWAHARPRCSMWPCQSPQRMDNPAVAWSVIYRPCQQPHTITSSVHLSKLAPHPTTASVGKPTLPRVKQPGLQSQLLARVTYAQWVREGIHQKQILENCSRHNQHFTLVCLWRCPASQLLTSLAQIRWVTLAKPLVLLGW